MDPLRLVKIENPSLSGVLSEGSRFGVYVIGACIGHGGMARIYRAEHEGLRRSVALKVLTDGFARDPEGRERFLREARIAAAIKHPNVVNIFDVGVQDDIPYLVMELLEGEDLEALVNRRGALTESMLVDIVVPIVAGLAAVHDAGVVHRDLKPGNIFLAKGRTDEFEPKLLDFGISRAAESDQFKLTTARGLLMGTPLYMSPEAIQGGEITALSDQYSLGVVLYECSTGFNPFAADTLAETVRRVTTGDFAPPSQHNPAISRRLARIISRAMSLDPAQRYSDLREMGRELLLLAGQRTRITWSLSFGEIVGRRTGSLAVMSDGLASAPSARPGSIPAAPGARRKLINAIAISLGAVAFAGAGALLWSKTHPVSPDVAQQSLQASALPPAAAAAPLPAPVEAEPAATDRARVSDDRLGDEPAPGERASAASQDAPPSRRAPRSTGARTTEARDVEPARREEEPRARRVRATTPPPQRAQPRRAHAPAADETGPEWLLDSEPPTPTRRRPQRRDTNVGTNAAPIFD